MTSASLCQGTGMYPVRVWEEYVQLDDRGKVLFRTNTLGAEQSGTTSTRVFGTCPHCRLPGYEITDRDTVRLHHLIR